MEKYFKRLKYGGKNGRKARFDFKCHLFSFGILALIAVMAICADAVMGTASIGICAAGLGLMGVINTSGMSDEDKKKWEAIDEALGLTADKYLKENIKIEDFKTSVIDAIKGMDEFKKVDVSGFIKEKAFNDKIKLIEDELVVIKGLTEVGKGGAIKIKSLDNQIADQLKDFIKEENGRMVVDLKEACQKASGRQKTINIMFDVKAAPITSAGAPHIGTVLDPSVSVDPKSQTVIRKYANVTTINGRSLVIAEFVSGAGDAGWVPEGGLKPSMTATLQESTVSVGKVALTAKFTEESLYDLPQLVAEVKTELVNRIGLTEEDGILNGDGTNGEIKGVLSGLPGFALTGLTVDRPNMYDAIVAAYTQIVSTSKMSYRPNLVLMNPVDYADMQLEKDTSGQYLRPFKVGDELISGLMVEMSTAIEQGELFIGDFNYFNIRDYVALSLTFGWENDDFTKNMVTMIGEKRLMAYVKKQYKTAFVYDTFANVITAITKTP